MIAATLTAVAFGVAFAVIGLLIVEYGGRIVRALKGEGGWRE